MKGFLKFIAVIISVASAALIINTMIDVLYKKSTKYIESDEEE